MVLGPGGAPAVLEVDVIHLVLLPEALSDAEDVLVLPPLDVDGVEGVLEQPDLRPLKLEALLLAGVPAAGEAVLLDVEGLDEHHESVFEFFDVVFEPADVPLRLLVEDFELEAGVGFVFALDFGVLGGVFVVAGVVVEGGLVGRGEGLLGREEGTAYFCFQ